MGGGGARALSFQQVRKSLTPLTPTCSTVHASACSVDTTRVEVRA